MNRWFVKRRFSYGHILGRESRHISSGKGAYWRRGCWKVVGIDRNGKLGAMLRHVIYGERKLILQVSFQDGFKLYRALANSNLPDLLYSLLIEMLVHITHSGR